MAEILYERITVEPEIEEDQTVINGITTTDGSLDFTPVDPLGLIRNYKDALKIINSEGDK